MKDRPLQSGTVHFQTEGRLLQELGERLVASPEVALVELIKNSYDADAATSEITVSDDGSSLTIRDDGSGMTFEDFQNRWMRIATRAKDIAPKSKSLGRRVTGQKGIGRFAVRFLGSVLRLDSVAFDQTTRKKTRLTATFDWVKIDAQHDLQHVDIPYKLSEVDEATQPGTTLIVESLRMAPSFVLGKDFRTKVLRIVSPIQGLDAGRYGFTPSASAGDAGFRVLLPSDESAVATPLDLAKKLLDLAWARLEIDLRAEHVEYTVGFLGDSKPRKLKVPLKSLISQGCRGDIRFFPKRKGVFKERAINGQQAWQWVRDNHGIAVIDHGFRVKPFGFPEDDWLSLDADGARNRREWRTEIANKHLPMSPKERTDPGLNPALNLPSNLQLVGAVYVESRPGQPSMQRPELVPSMDREGFQANAAFEQLVEVVRGGIEFLASSDKRRLLEEQERKAREETRKVRADLRAAIEYVEASPTLGKADKAKIVANYVEIAEKVERIEEYNQEARQKLEVMSSLGVVAGFMTHEAEHAAEALESASECLKRLARRYAQLKEDSAVVEEGSRAMQELLEYTRNFVDAAHSMKPVTFKAATQIRLIIAKFGRFAEQRGISVTCDAEASLEVPPMPVTVYSGVLLNLYTNALKAILAMRAVPRASRIVFRAWNDARGHVVDVVDTGIGVPPELRARIWDPLFTTTSRAQSPLGSGMGLGLTLVRQLVTGIGGTINLIDPPAGFSTCFRVKFPGAKRRAK
jgi:signal transduction histidine kinase